MNKNKTNKKAVILSSFVMLALIMPVFLLNAQADPCESGQGLCNPLKANSIYGLFKDIVNFVYSLSYIVIAIFLVISGFKFVTAQGNETKLSDAKKTFYYTIIGAVLLIAAQVITKVVENLINQFSKNPIS